ncbi:MAG: ATP-binding protein [Bryobacteraceae bacterium]
MERGSMTSGQQPGTGRNMSSDRRIGLPERRAARPAADLDETAVPPPLATRPAGSTRARLGAILVLTGGLFFSFLAWRAAVDRDHESWRRAYESAVRDRVAVVLREFESLAERLRAIGNVPPERVARVAPGLSVLRLSPGDPSPMVLNEGSQVSAWLERAAEGEILQEAMRRAQRTGRPAMSPRLDPDTTDAAANDARVAIAVPVESGVVAGVISVKETVEHALDQLDPFGMHVVIEDRDAGPAERLYLHLSRLSKNANATTELYSLSNSTGPWRRAVLVEALGRRWQVVCHPVSTVVPGSSFATLASGLIMTILAAMLTWLNGNRRHRVEGEVRIRTQALVEAIGRLRDEISQRQEAEIELARARDRALESSRLKSEFLTNVSHELRTPLHGVLGLTQLALDGDLRDEQRDYLQTAFQSGQSLLGLLNELLDFNQIENNRLVIDASHFSPRSCVEDVVKMLAWQAKQKGLRLYTEAAPDVPARVVGDAMRLRQVIANLVGNAIKFTDTGEVRVSVRATGQGRDGMQLEFCVADTGIGIAPEDHESIFEAFRQVDGSMTRRRGGTGIGLSISRRLVELMQGHIWVSSELARGTRFYFTIHVQPETEPLTDGKSRTRSKSGRAKGDALRVLLVEDQPAHRLVVERMLQKMGHIVSTADDGQTGFERWLKDDFDVVLTDIQMPVLDGIAMAEKMRRTDLTGERRVAIVALTAHASEAEKQRCLAAGLDAFLSKPFTDVELQQVLTQVAHAEGGGETTAVTISDT